MNLDSTTSRRGWKAFMEVGGNREGIGPNIVRDMLLDQKWSDIKCKSQCFL